MASMSRYYSRHSHSFSPLGLHSRSPTGSHSGQCHSSIHPRSPTFSHSGQCLTQPPTLLAVPSPPDVTTFIRVHGLDVQAQGIHLVFRVVAQAKWYEELTALGIPGQLASGLILERKLHKQSSELALGETHLWFSKDAPKPNGWGLLEDITRGIPPRSSISDPRFNDGADRLPLWTLTFWEKMAEVAKHQALWKRSAAWLDTEGAKRNGDEETKKSVEAARAVMKTMGWNTPAHMSPWHTLYC
ncbi:hypothetical protein B0H10DRAFT_2234546 [Mycena sp. CBHHK59/15]|nr:hypothetical protein B0H10DRAFT_2234546 [Mycena sp. CBHHK59/15]